MLKEIQTFDCNRLYADIYEHPNYDQFKKLLLMACPPKVVPSVKLVFVENERDTEYDTQTVHA
jgi:hypothetical protein